MVSVESRLDIRARYPNMGVVAQELFPTAKYELTPMDSYEKSLRLQGRLTPSVQESLGKAREWQEKSLAVVYIAGGLTGVDEQTKLRYGEVSSLLDSYGTLVDSKGSERQLLKGYVPHLHGTDPVKHPNVTSDEVRDIDHLWAVVVASVHVNFLHPMAHGNAIEEGWGEGHLITSSTQNLEGNKLSRLVLGMNNIAHENNYREFNVEDIEGLRLFTDEFSVWIRTFPNRDPREFFYMSPELLRVPVLVEKGLDLKGWNPVFNASSFLLYVRDPKHPDYGKVGELDGHDWRESGMYFVKFPDGSSALCYDGFEKEVGACEVFFWLK